MHSQSTHTNSSEIEICVRFMKTNPPYVRKWNFKELGTGPTKPLPSIQQPLKQLPPHLRYAYLGESSALLVIISNSINEVEDERLLRVIRDN